jgi:hypothetical protein
VRPISSVVHGDVNRNRSDGSATWLAAPGPVLHRAEGARITVRRTSSEWRGLHDARGACGESGRQPDALAPRVGDGAGAAGRAPTPRCAGASP